VRSKIETKLCAAHSQLGQGIRLSNCVRSLCAPDPPAASHGRIVHKLAAARARKKALTGRAATASLSEVAALAKEMHRQRMSLRKISAALAERGQATSGGKASHTLRTPCKRSEVSRTSRPPQHWRPVIGFPLWNKSIEGALAGVAT
jgi:hypothetical protein